MALTVKTDDVTRGRKDVDPHGRLQSFNDYCNYFINCEYKQMVVVVVTVDSGANGLKIVLDFHTVQRMRR